MQSQFTSQGELSAFIPDLKSLVTAELYPGLSSRPGRSMVSSPPMLRPASAFIRVNGTMSMSGRFFAAGLMAWSSLGAGAYAWDGDWRRAIYWTAATVLTGVVTF